MGEGEGTGCWIKWNASMRWQNTPTTENSDLRIGDGLIQDIIPPHCATHYISLVLCCQGSTSF